MTVAVHPSKVVASVPKLWPGGTIACLGTGPSLTAEDVNALRGKVSAVVAVSDAYKLAPWADVLYACDSRWWNWHKGVPTFQGRKYSMIQDARRWPGVQILRNSGDTGIETNPTALKAGRNSGYQAVNLAVHLGAARILLLGYDMKGTHFFGKHPDNSVPPFQVCLLRFATMVEPLAKLGVKVINCTPGSALECFPKMTLAEALCS